MMRLEHRLEIFRARCCGTDVRLEVFEERVEDGIEEDDLLVGDLVEDGDEGADGFEEVELGVEDGGGGGGFGEDDFGGRFGVGEGSGHDEEVLPLRKEVSGEEQRQEEKGNAPACPSRSSVPARPKRSLE
jgi:hypothetical protein